MFIVFYLKNTLFLLRQTNLILNNKLKKLNQLYCTYILLLCTSYTLFAQQITTNSNITLQQLIEDNLIEGCVEVSNITSTINGIPNGFSSYAQFDKAGSNFPFQNGIVLSTGDANSGGNTENNNVLSEGVRNWIGDTDLEALGVNNTINATSIEFDFISISNRISFNYILASEEYTGVNPCFFADGFAFLIKETGSAAPFQNIALVPGTNTPVNTSTIRNEVIGLESCPAQNNQFFAGQNIGDTNYNGRTTVLTATASLIPNVQYRIKLVIADQGGDTRLDSAVFIEGNSFKTLDLGEDITTCASNVTLDANINNPTSTYAWFLNNDEITNQTNPTLIATQTGTYRVEITNQLTSGDNCIEEDEIIVNLSSEQAVNTISDFKQCDDSSEDEIELFNLTTKNNDVNNIDPFVNSAISYHLTDEDARGNNAPITAPVQNTSNPQEIFVRIEDLDSGCLAITSFNLIVSPIPNITTPTDLLVCDDDGTPDGQTILDLTQKDEEITGGNLDYSVSYHFTNNDALTGNNAVSSSYTNTNSTENFFVRVINVTTGCVNTTTLNVNIAISPTINRETQFIDACDRDLDGMAIFDLTSVTDDILDGLTDPVTVTFHETIEDANMNVNAIPNPTNFANTILNEQSIFVRVANNNSECFSITRMEIHTNLLLTETNITNVSICDDASNDGIADFDLLEIEERIANSLPDVTVTYYESESDLETNTNPLTKNTPYNTTSPTTLYISIDNTLCVEQAEINLIINPVFELPPLDTITICDEDDDGVTDIQLNEFDSLLTGGNTNLNVVYFSSQEDADQDINPLPSLYRNTNIKETLFVRVADNDTGCSTPEQIDIEILLAPTITQPTPFIICDDNQDGFFTINLEDKISEVVTNTSGLNIDFFTSINNAQNNVNPLSIAQRTAYNANTQSIAIRVENSVTGCFDVTGLSIIVNTLPIIENIDDLLGCENDNDSRTEFIFSDKDADILNSQTGKEVLYFEDASRTILIDPNTAYTNISNPQTIYIKVQNITDPNCFEIGSFNITVGSNPIYTPPIDILECDDSSNDGVAVFDFLEKTNRVNNNGTENNIVSYHLSQIEAENNTNPLDLQFTNTLNPQQIFTRIQSSTSECFMVESFDINIIASPNLSDAEPLEICDIDNNGTEIFNLENAQFTNFDRIQTDIETRYFENESDTDNNALSIENPTNYLSNTKTIYIKVSNRSTTCSRVIPLRLVVNQTPIINVIPTFQICDNDTKTFNLTEINNLIVNNTNLANITYHTSPSDAESNINPIDQNIFNYTANTHNIYSRVENINSNCVSTGVFTLQINNNPLISPLTDLELCNDDFNDTTDFDLSVKDSQVLGGLNSTNYSVSYYNNSADAANNVNNLDINYVGSHRETIFTRLENNVTGCFSISQFNLLINNLPVIPINDEEPLCLNNLPMEISANTGNPTDTYLWDDGQTTPEVLYTQANLGAHSVTVTKSTGCSSTKNFTLIESEAATIDVTTVVNFTDPNSITVTVSGIGDYVYILDEANGGQPQRSNTFQNVSFGMHTVTVRDINGCMDIIKEVTVFDIPKFITPNNDGRFDTWHIVGVNQLPGTVVYVYSRYGKLLRILTHNSPGWDGRYNGVNMPADDYWYSADILQDGTSFNIKGHFALKR